MEVKRVTILLAIEAERHSLTPQLRHSDDLDDRALRRQVAFQADDGPGRGERARHRADHVLIGREHHVLQIFGESALVDHRLRSRSPGRSPGPPVSRSGADASRFRSSAGEDPVDSPYSANTTVNAAALLDQTLLATNAPATLISVVDMFLPMPSR